MRKFRLKNWLIVITMFIYGLITILLIEDYFLRGQHIDRPLTTIPVVICPGDTLWSIAKTYYPDKHTGQMVEVIRQLNPDVDPGRLQVGQVVWLPGEVMQ